MLTHTPSPSQECESFQADCLREESRFHYLHALTAIIEANIEKVRQEEKWEAGEGQWHSQPQTPTPTPASTHNSTIGAL